MSSNQTGERGQVLLTGGTGFIGAPLAQYLRRLGYNLWVLTRQPEGMRIKSGAGISYVRQLADLPKVDFDVVINLAGEPLAAGRWNSSRKAVFRSSRIDGTAHLFDFFQKRKSCPQVLISGSAIGIYGDCGDRLVSEEKPAGDDFAATLCHDWERAAQAFADSGARVCLLRTGIVLEQDGGVLAKMLPPFRMGLGGNLGKGQQWMSWIHRQDLIRLILFCIDNHQMSGPVNGVAPEAVTNADFTHIMGQVLHRPTLLPMPHWLLRMLFGEMADALMLASQRIIPEVAIRQGFVFEYPELETALKNILDKK